MRSTMQSGMPSRARSSSFSHNRDAAERIIQMGEDPARVHCVGSTGLDRLMKVQPMPREDFFGASGSPPESGPCSSPCTGHARGGSAGDARALLSALRRLPGSFGMLITGSNADAGGKELNAMLESFTRGPSKCRAACLAGYGPVCQRPGQLRCRRRQTRLAGSTRRPACNARRSTSASARRGGCGPPR